MPSSPKANPSLLGSQPKKTPTKKEVAGAQIATKPHPISKRSLKKPRRKDGRHMYLKLVPKKDIKILLLL